MRTAFYPFAASGKPSRPKCTGKIMMAFAGAANKALDSRRFHCPAQRAITAAQRASPVRLDQSGRDRNNRWYSLPFRDSDRLLHGGIGDRSHSFRSARTDGGFWKIANVRNRRRPGSLLTAYSASSRSGKPCSTAFRKSLEARKTGDLCGGTFMALPVLGLMPVLPLR